MVNPLAFARVAVLDIRNDLPEPVGDWQIVCVKSLKEMASRVRWSDWYGRKSFDISVKGEPIEFGGRSTSPYRF